MAANAADLVLAATVASDFGLTNDAKLERCVTAASKHIARHCDRVFEKAAAIVEYPASYDSRFLVVDRFPILSIASIYEGDTLVTATDYEAQGVYANAGMILRKGAGRWMRTAQDDGEITRAFRTHAGETGSYGVKVTYAAGYATPGQNSLEPLVYPAVTLPEDLQMAAALMAAGLHRRLSINPNIAAQALGDWSVTYRASLQMLITPDVAAMIDPYRRLSVL